MTCPGEALRRVDEEIARQKVQALGRAGERLEAARALAAGLGRRLDASRDPAERARPAS
jgi:hypothetical protein